MRVVDLEVGEGEDEGGDGEGEECFGEDVERGHACSIYYYIFPYILS